MIAWKFFSNFVSCINFEIFCEMFVVWNLFYQTWTDTGTDLSFLFYSPKVCNSGKKSRQIFIFAHALPLIKFGNLLWFFLQCILVIGFFWYFGTFLDEFLGLLRIIECNEPILLSFHENSLWWVINLNLMLWDFRSRKKSLDLNFMLLIDDVENVSNTFFHGMTHKVWLIFKLNTAGDNGKLDLITVGYLPAMGLCQM